MKPQRFFVICVCFFTLCQLSAVAQQQSDPSAWDKGTIESQLQYVVEKSNMYQDYKVMKAWWLFTLKTNISDSVKALKSKVKDREKIVADRETQIDSLKSAMLAVNNQLSIAIKEKDNMYFLGVPMTKIGYNSMVWFIIVSLVVLLGFFIAMFRRCNVVTMRTRKDFAQLKEEFEIHRKRALEREEKMARKHLDELNKYKTY